MPDDANEPEKMGRRQGRMQPSGYDLQPAHTALGNAALFKDMAQLTCNEDSNDIESTTYAKESAEAFQRQIPALKKKPDVPAILAGMHEHIAHSGVQKAACQALFNLSDANDENDEKILRAGGIKLILEAMRAHKTVSGVQEQGCRALKNLAANEYVKKGIALEGGISTILEGPRATAH